MARKRAGWQKHQRDIDLQRLVFIDETWAKTNMAPLRGWAARGQRLIGKAPFGHWIEGLPATGSRADPRDDLHRGLAP